MCEIFIFVHDLESLKAASASFIAKTLYKISFQALSYFVLSRKKKTPKSNKAFQNKAVKSIQCDI